MPKLNIKTLCKEANLFSASQSKSPVKSLYGVTDGKAVGTYLEHEFRNHLKNIGIIYLPFCITQRYLRITMVQKEP